MGSATQQIERHIDETREEFGANLQELEDKMKRMVDWRYRFETNPVAMIGIAFGSGLLMSAVLSRRSRRPVCEC